MMALANNWANNWAIHVVHLLWQATIAAGIVLALVRLLPRSHPRLRHAIVLIALAKFVIPPMLPLPTGIFSAAPPVPELTAARDFVSGTDGRLFVALMLLHLGGMLIAFARLGAEAWTLRGIRRRATASNGFFLSDEISVPVTTGVWRPMILIPNVLAATLAPAALGDVIAHERQHVRRRDVLRGWIEAGIAALWWFHPLVHVLVREARILREECCDDALIAGGQCERGHYARTLLTAAAFVSGPAPAAAAAIAESEHSLLRRVRRLADAGFVPKARLSLAAVLFVLAADHLTVSAHVTTTADVHHALEAGVDEVTHLPLAPIDAADAALAAKRGVTFVTTTLSHRPAVGVADLAALHRSNLELLKKAGVKVLLGVDNGERNVIHEAESVRKLGVYSDLELLRMLTESTPRAIFPSRKIGRLEDGAEASLLALEGNPLEDFGAVRRIAVRIKQGHVLEIAPEKPSIAEALMPIVMEHGAEAAIAEYRRLERAEPAKWDFREPRLNQLGYALLNHGKSTEAIAIFQLNAEKYPKSSNVWDSLAEAYMKAGQRELAIANYRKALELNPGNKNAADMLKKLSE